MASDVNQTESDANDMKVLGLEPTFRHLDDDDVPWQRVKSIRRSDGTTASVWEKWLAFSADPQYLSLYAKWDRGMVIRRHGHYSSHVIFVIEGDMWCGDRHCPAGTHIELPLGAAFGPFVAGPGGTVLFEVMMGDPRSWGDDFEAFQSALDRQNATRLPDPELEFPDWLEDLRTRWVVDGSETQIAASDHVEGS
jgi:hypothetical protein